MVGLELVDGWQTEQKEKGQVRRRGVETGDLHAYLPGTEGVSRRRTPILKLRSPR